MRFWGVRVFATLSLMRWSVFLFLVLSPALAQVSPHWLYEVSSRLVGVPYRWGGNGTGGFDCSGLVVYIYRHLGVNLPRTSREQYAATFRVQDLKALKPGDLLFFSSSGKKVDHVGIYLYPHPTTGEPLMLHASGQWGRVVVEPVNRYQNIFVGAGRVWPTPPPQGGGAFRVWTP